MMTPGEARRLIADKAKKGKVVVRFHASQRARQKDRDFQIGDIINILSFPGSVVPSGNTEWEVRGKDLDGKPGKAVVAIEDDVIVITVVRGKP